VDDSDARGYIEDIDEIFEDYQRILKQWDEACEKVFMAVFFTFEDVGLVEPYYDPTNLCASQEETWEVFV
jgi:hypothetical protein